MREIRNIFIYFLLATLMTQVSLGQEQENTLSFKDVMTRKESSAYKILSLEIQEMGVLITAQKGKSCFLPFHELIDDKIVDERCRADGYTAIYEQEVEKWKEFFLNAKNYSVRCSFRDDNLVGYSFIGHTVTEGGPSYVNRSLAFDLSQYPEPEPERSPGPLKKLGMDMLRVLNKLLIGL